MTLICDDLKLYHRLTYIHNWYLQMYFKSKINISNQTFSFQAPSIVTKWKFDNLHILTKNHTLGGHVYTTAICRSTLGELKIPTITAEVFKLQYQYKNVFYEKRVFYRLIENCTLRWKRRSSTRNLSQRIPLIQFE